METLQNLFVILNIQKAARLCHKSGDAPHHMGIRPESDGKILPLRVLLKSFRILLVSFSFILDACDRINNAPDSFKIVRKSLLPEIQTDTRAVSDNLRRNMVRIFIFPGLKMHKVVLTTI